MNYELEESADKTDEQLLETDRHDLSLFEDFIINNELESHDSPRQEHAFLDNNHFDMDINEEENFQESFVIRNAITAETSNEGYNNVRDHQEESGKEISVTIIKTGYLKIGLC